MIKKILTNNFINNTFFVIAIICFILLFAGIIANWFFGFDNIGIESLLLLGTPALGLLTNWFYKFIKR